MKTLPKKYNHKEAEKRWQDYWVENETYAWDESQPRDNTFVIDTPPPTVSGLLHMGHIFSYTQADFVARYQRMKGKTVFYPMGFDDNGLPTERLVEKTKKIKANKFISENGREAFIDLCADISLEARQEFRRLFQSTALSVDWKQEYHTISEDSRKISQLSFLDLFHKNKAYRKLQPMLWDPVDQTAIAQAEVEDKEMAGTFNDITFGVDGSDETFVIGTTRPELIPACVGIFYHPDDERYKHLAGKQAVTPLFGVKVPILEDDTVEMDKGTGIMMCCTFGDEADILKWQKHDLPARIVLDNYGKVRLNDKEWLANSDEAIISELDGKRGYHQDKNVPNVRSRIIELLDEAGKLVKSEDIKHAVPCAERSGSPLEILPTQQWFVKVIEEREALKAKAEECNWYPHFMKLRIDQWIDGLSWDWCISRQRYFGVPFPIWYIEEAEDISEEVGNKLFAPKYKFNKLKTVVAKPEQLPVNPLNPKVSFPDGYEFIEEVTQFAAWNEGMAVKNTPVYIGKKDDKYYCILPEQDVMDTWATSSVSPQLNSKGITDELAIDSERHSKLFPADLRPQAHEIIRTWAFYTIVKAHLHEDQIPWNNLMISGWCLAEDKTKMSKSKGNVVTPVDLIEEEGTDAVRFWASTSRLGSDTAFSKDVLKIGKKLVNKLFNASKFAAIQLERIDGTPTTAVQDVENGIITETLDKWVLTRLNRSIEKATAQFEVFEYATAREAVEDFFWNDFCDNYLEMVKKRAYDEEGNNPAAQQSAIFTIYHCLEAVLKLFAPFVPHITEEIYSHIFDERFEDSIHKSGTWPKAAEYPVDDKAEEAGIATRQILDVVRKVKGDKGVSIKWPIEELIIGESEHAPSQHEIVSCFEDLASVTNSKRVDLGQSAEHITTDNGAWNVAVQLAEESDKEAVAS